MRALVFLLMMAAPATADSMVATRTIRAQSVIAPEDIAMVSADIPGALSAARDAIGMETRVTLYAGRPVREADLAPPALVKRNQVVPLTFHIGGLTIRTEGRALERGAEGDVIPVMNLSSHLTIRGQVGADGSIVVGPNSKG